MNRCGGESGSSSLLHRLSVSQCDSSCVFDLSTPVLSFVFRFACLWGPTWAPALLGPLCIYLQLYACGCMNVKLHTPCVCMNVKLPTQCGCANVILGIDNSLLAMKTWGCWLFCLHCCNAAMRVADKISKARGKRRGFSHGATDRHSGYLCGRRKQWKKPRRTQKLGTNFRHTRKSGGKFLKHSKKGKILSAHTQNGKKKHTKPCGGGDRTPNKTTNCVAFLLMQCRYRFPFLEHENIVTVIFLAPLQDFHTGTHTHFHPRNKNWKSECNEP